MASSSVHKLIIEAVVARIKAIGLAGIVDANIIAGKVNPNLPDGWPGIPGIAVSPIGTERISEGGGTNISEDIEYPVHVIMLDADRGTGAGVVGDEQPDQILSFDPRLLWREQIRKQLWHKPEALRTAGAPATVCEVSWVPGVIVDPARWINQNLWLGAHLFYVKSIEVRT